ncbi:MAG: EAL domain-containing protein, partial [Halanaerobiaceae bacterium]
LIFYTISLLIISYALSKWVNIPLIKLDSATRKIAAEGPESFEKVDISTGDEFDRLAESFNEMTNRLVRTTVSKTYVENIISSMNDALLVTDKDYKIRTANKTACSLLQYKEGELVQKKLDQIIISSPENSNRDNLLEKIKKGKQIKNHQVFYKTSSGAKIPVLLSCSRIKAKNNKISYILTARDISDLKKAEQKLKKQAAKMEHLAKHDTLTNLPNRYYFEEQLKKLINNTKISTQQHALLFLDLDKFKVINDTCGHFAGDRLLTKISNLLKNTVRNSDIVARIGGDEFGIILKNIPISKACSTADRICERIKENRFTWEGKAFSIGVSIGIAIIDYRTDDYEKILSTADKCCYLAKEKGGNRFYLFSEDDQNLSRHNLEVNWLPVISKTIEENRFLLHYQPIISAAEPTSHKWYEILIRMIDEDGNLIMPGDFLPAAERYNMMPAIDRWVVEHFFALYKKHFMKQDNPPVFNINISGTSINEDNFLSFLKEQFDKYSIPPEKICFELTESVAVSNFIRANEFMQELRKTGCKFALDDFGSGFSSFEYLKHLAVDYIKINGSFIQNILSSELDYTMVSSINDITRALELQAIAEYVESENIYNKLIEIGIDYAQGYWIGKPEPLEKLY